MAFCGGPRWGRFLCARNRDAEAKEFARQKLADTQNITAGTLNPHLPKRLIPPAQLIEWLEEPHDTDAAP